MKTQFFQVLSWFQAFAFTFNLCRCAAATTNAIVGGLIVIEALKVLRAAAAKKNNAASGENGDGDAAPATPGCCNYKDTFVRQFKSNNRLLEPIDPWGPSAKCHVCGNARMVGLYESKACLFFQACKHIK